jgi:membrane protein implicated in regulation of membrane protease activity
MISEHGSRTGPLELVDHRACVPWPRDPDPGRVSALDRTCGIGRWRSVLHVLGHGAWGWQIQLLVFAVLALAFALIGRRISASNSESDQPMLNRRVEGLVGRTATLEDPISDGKGRIRLDDTTWIVHGPDMPAGTRVRITTAQAGGLTVERA